MVSKRNILFYLLLTSCLTVHAMNVYVSQKHGDSQNDCIYSNHPCQNLTFALESFHNTNSTNFHIDPGQYMLNTEITFIHVRDIQLLSSGSGTVEIHCYNQSDEFFEGEDTLNTSGGLTFIHSVNIIIKGISFHGCGIQHNSTTLHKEEMSLNETFVPFYAALYFEQCVDVHLESLSIKDSVQVGIQMYATVGVVNIMQCEFVNNPQNESEQLGGGLLIEFPYCLPGNLSSCNDNESFVPMNIISNSNYFISECVFDGNRAKPYFGFEKFLLPFKTKYEAFGFGGGLSLVFRANSSDNLIQIDTCYWYNNTAMYGGGLYIKMTDSSCNNIIKVTGFNVFTDNHARKNGGGVMFNYLFLDGSVYNNSIQANGMIFNGNDATDKGGGIYYLTTLQPLGKLPNSLEISNCTMENNTAKLGSAVDLSLFHPVSGDYMSQVVITNCSFISNAISYTSSSKGTVLGAGTMHVDQIPIVFRESIEFINNTDQSALVVTGTKVEFATNTSALFNGNSGENGGAIGLYSSAYIRINKDTSLVFTNNMAKEQGGAIYSHSFGTSIQKTSLNCMIRYHDIRVHPEDWLTSFIFNNNTANGRCNSIYASTIHPCALLSITRSHHGQEIDKVFCWNDNSSSAVWMYNDRGDTDTCKEHIQTDISSFDSTSDSRIIKVMPGNKTKLDLIPLNDQNNDVSSYILHAYAQDKSIAVNEEDYYFSTPKIILYKTSNYTDIITSTITVDTVQTNIVQVDITVHFMECNAGFELKENKLGHYGCECIFPDKPSMIICQNESLSAKLLHGFWIGKIKDTDTFYTIGHCINCNKYIKEHIKDSYIQLNEPLEDIQPIMCNNNTTGVLCSKCDTGYAPAIDYNELRCVPCNSKIDKTGVSLFIVFDIVLPVLFLSLVYLLDVPLTSGLLHGPILICQMVSTVGTLDAGDIIPYHLIFNGSESMETAYTAYYNFFNLYFGQTLLQKHCLSDRIEHYATMIVINYIPSLLPLVIVLLFAMVYYCLGKCYRRLPRINTDLICSKSPRLKKVIACVINYIRERRNKANFLATAILLSYTKLAVTTCYLLTPVLLHRSDGSKAERVMYLDGTIPYKSSQHLPYLVVASFGAIFLIIVPFILVLYRPNNPQTNGGFFNHLLGQYHDEFRARELPSDINRYKTWDLDRPVIVGERNLFDIRSEGRYSYCNPTTFFCKFRCTRHFNTFFNTNVSRYDFRWFAGAIFVLRLFIILSFAISWTSLIQYVFQVITCVVYAIIVMTFRPFKKKDFNGTGWIQRFLTKIDPNFIEASFMLLLALMFVLSIYQYYYAVTDGTNLSTPAYAFQVFLAWIPIVWIAIAYCMLFYLEHKEGLNSRCPAFCCRSRAQNPEERPLIMELNNAGIQENEAVENIQQFEA